MSRAIKDAPVSKDARKLDIRILLLALATFVLRTDSLIVIGILPTIARELRVTEGAAHYRLHAGVRVRRAGPGGSNGPLA
ncbi:MAG: MFS transporter [Ktedonobacteraceae bacterium]|nr:MFS transporter [Ktedonobacteraceae bacterium]